MNAESNAVILTTSDTASDAYGFGAFAESDSSYIADENLDRVVIYLTLLKQRTINLVSFDSSENVAKAVLRVLDGDDTVVEEWVSDFWLLPLK